RRWLTSPTAALPLGDLAFRIPVPGDGRRARTAGVRCRAGLLLPLRRARASHPMIQELFHIGSFSISPFGVMLVFSFVGSYLQLRWGLRRLGIGDEEDASAIVFAAGVGGIVGAKVYYAILYGS